MSEAFDLDDLTPQELHFTYAGKSLVLREASEAAVYAWKNAGLKFARQNDKGEFVGATGGAELDSQLVANCLFEKTDKGEKSVGADVVRSWPSRLVQGLYKKVLELSAIGSEETQGQLEKRFGELCLKLAELASDDAERRKWAEWMIGTVQDRLAVAPAPGAAEEAEKNGAPTAPATSASRPS